MVVRNTIIRPSWLPKYVPKAGDGCALWLPGQDDPMSAIIRDRSGNNNTGVITGATWIRNGKGLWELYFGGDDDSVTVTSASILNPAATLTLMCWARPERVTQSPAYLLAKLGGVAGTGQYLIYHELTKLEGAVYQSDNTFKGVTDSPYVLVNGTPIHVALVADGTNVILYINGAVSGTPVAYDGTIQGNAADFRMGINDAETAGRWFKGYLALVLLSSKAYTAAEVYSEYRAGRALFGV